MTSPRKPGRALSEDERSLWQGVARSIAPMRGQRRGSPRPAGEITEPSESRAKRDGSAGVSPRARAGAKGSPAVEALDRRTKRKLARGNELIAARLDLHGMTQAQAHGALARFLRRAQAKGARYVLVVTGKGGRGNAGERGVLRRIVPLWLELPELRDVVVGFDAANIGHGGEGALYVRLRRSQAR